MKQYYIEKTEKINISINDELWDKIEPLKIDTMPWPGFETNIHTTVKIVYSDKEMTVHFETDEKNLRAKMREDGDPVCLDSCMEFFFGTADRTRYMNIEINPLGVVALGVKFPEWRRSYKNGSDLINVTSLITKDLWKLQYPLPFSFIERELGALGKRFSGNFYKCGSETGHKHYMCWEYVDTEKPIFHSPQFFGELVFK